MLVFNNFSCTAVPVTPGQVYTLTLEADRKAIPVDSKRISLVLQDSANNMARVLADSVGDVSAQGGATFTIRQVFSTSESDNSFPSFGAGLRAFSSDVAEVLNRSMLRAGIPWWGQSIGPGINTGKVNLNPRFFREQMHGLYENTYNLAGRGDNKEGYLIEPVSHITPSISGAAVLGTCIPFAELFRREEGWAEVHILPNCISASSINTFLKPSSSYDKLLNSLIEFSDNHPLNYIALEVNDHGYTDQSTMAASEFITKRMQIRSDLAADFFAARGQDISKLPTLQIGLHVDFKNSASYNTTNDFDAGVRDIVNNMANSAYVELPDGMSRNADSANEDNSTDETHLSALGSMMQAPLMYAEVANARMNTNPAPDVTAPTISSPAGSEVGSSGYTGSISTDEGNGTLYHWVTQNATETLADIKANGQSQAVSTVGVQNVSGSGLTSLQTYYIHYVHTDAAGNDSSVSSSASFTTTAVADTTPPALSSPTGSKVGHNAGSGTVTTDEDNGTLFFYISQNSTETIATIKASGQSQSVTVSGVQNVSVNALSASSTYYLHYVHTDLAGNDSAAVSSASFTTDAAPDTTAPVISSPTGTATSSTGADGAVTTDEGNGTLYYYYSLSASETLATIKAMGNSQAVSGTGVQNISVTGLSAGTTYFLHYVHTDAAGNDSNVVSSASFATPTVGPSTPNVDLLAPLLHFRADHGLLTGTGNDFASWENIGSGPDITTVKTGNPQVDANGVNCDGDDGIQCANDDLITDAAGSSIVIKYSGSAGSRLVSSVTSAIELVAGKVVWQTYFSHEITGLSGLDDGAEHVIAVTVAPNGQMIVYLDGSVIGSVATTNLSVLNSDLVFGIAHNATSGGLVGYIKAIIGKPGVAWSQSQINGMEMPA